MADRRVLFFDEQIEGIRGAKLLFAPVRAAFEPVFNQTPTLTPFTVLQGVETVLDILDNYREASWFILTHVGRTEAVRNGFGLPEYAWSHLMKEVRTRELREDHRLDAHVVLLAPNDSLREQAKLMGVKAFFATTDEGYLEGLMQEFNNYLAKMPRAA